MISVAHFRRLQKLFFCKVTSGCNISRLTVELIGTTHENDFEEFLGDGEREIVETYELSCFYQKNLSDKDREKYGVDQNVTTIVYVSPVELYNKTGSYTFPDYFLNAFSGHTFKLFSKHYEAVNVVPLENMIVGQNEQCLAYQINLGNADTGNVDFN